MQMVGAGESQVLMCKKMGGFPFFWKNGKSAHEKQARDMWQNTAVPM